MSADKFTPRPWIAEPQDGPRGPADYGFDIVQARPVGDPNYRGCIARVTDAEYINGITIPERDANARLIAAAPDMLHALRRAVLALAALPNFEPEYEIVSAAIAKATGAKP